MSDLRRAALLKQQALSATPSKSSLNRQDIGLVNPDDSIPPSSAASVTLLESTPTHSQGNRARRKTNLPLLLRVRLFHGIIQDIRARLPYYRSDWTDAWNYRVVPATALIFFSKFVTMIPSF